MKCLVNFITRRKNGNISTKTKEIEADTIGIGRATDQEIFLSDLRIAYKHARIVLFDDEYFIKSRALSGIKVDNSITSSVKLEIGVKVLIGNYQLTVIENSQYDLAVEIEQVSTTDTQDEELKIESKLDLNHTKLNKRTLSWIGFSIVFILFFIIPLLTSLFEPAKEISKKIPVIPSDISWKSGSLASVHHFFKDDCKTCHEKAFIQVEDQSCTQCHKDTHEHAADDLMVTENVNEIQCQNCHKEHNGKEGMIMASTDNFCSDCHINLKDTLGDQTQLLDVSDFGNDHPEFRVSIPVIKFGQQTVNRISLTDTEKLKEKNALIFSHKAHLNPDKPEKFVELTNNGTDKMVCADCHRPDSGGKAMQAFTFENQCQSCHQLVAGTKENPLNLPHEATTEVFYYIQQYYKALALEGGVPDQRAPASVRGRRRPGQSISPQERLEALEWADKKSNEVALDIFNYTLCKTCHQINYSENSTPPWNIKDFKVPDVWMPNANFDHGKHTTMECVDCHNVNDSENGSDVLMPAIASCQTCHSGAHDDDLLATGCIDCHSFHIGENLLGTEK